MSWFARFCLWLDTRLAPKATSWIKYGQPVTDTSEPLPPTS